MHLCKKWSKYAFAYAIMQMHNFPKPSYNDVTVLTNRFLWPMKFVITYFSISHLINPYSQNFGHCLFLSRNKQGNLKKQF